MRVLITGDREWKDASKIRQVLMVLKTAHPDAIIVQGGARGADSIAKIIGTELFGERQVETYPADWTRHGKAAGPIRNQQMLVESHQRAELDGHRLEHAVAFHADLAHSKGTKDMVQRLERAGIPVLKIT
jgi:hypothetical protein